jgi:CHAT domain-containing protein
VVQLGSVELTALSSESFLDLATRQWLGRSKEYSAPLHKLAAALIQEHQDHWLGDYLAADLPARAVTSLVGAVTANRDGQLDDAMAEARQAIGTPGLKPKHPLVLRAWLEQVYSLRRQSKGLECAKDSRSLASSVSRLGYTWLSTQVLLEESSCQAMIGDFDQAWRSALRAKDFANQSHYASLFLRAISLLAALDTNEGRIERSWDLSEEGLASFFSAAFPNERAFQFYSELEFAAEQNNQWELAASLQREALAYIQPLRRYDFEATAHSHLAAVEEVLGNVQEARNQVSEGEQLFSKLPPGHARDFLEAESKVALGSLEARFGSPQLAAVQLSGLENLVKNADNFTVRLSYEQAEADLQRRLRNESEEVSHLKKCIEIGEAGYQSLTSAPDRWEWERTTGSAYRRLIEIELSRKHDPLQSLAEWETYRASAIGNEHVLPLETRILHARAAILARTKQLGSSSAIVYARFPTFTAAWLLDRDGVQEFRLAGGSPVDRLVKSFYLLCSDPTSSVQKVKANGLRLYETLVGPIEEQRPLQGIVHVEADGSLASIPWLALMSKDGAYLGARLAIVNTPLAMHGDEEMSSKAPHGFLIAYPGAVSFGRTVYQPLKDAAAEASELAERSKEAIFLKGNDVTTANLAANLPDASIFHFAGHAITRDSGGELLVHGSRKGELFSSATISRLNLTNLQLAVLAACDTGTIWDAAKNPNGLVGAFLTAGTHRVVASLWAVDSTSTALLLSRFYLEFGSVPKHGPERSWQHAIEPDLGTHPYYWAGFQIFGY